MLHSINVMAFSVGYAFHVGFPFSKAKTIGLCGLLHDVGILILNQYAHDAYQQVLTIARDEQLRLWEAEMKVLGTTHERIGASLCAKWMLPAGLTQIISYHHTDEAPVDPAERSSSRVRRD